MFRFSRPGGLHHAMDAMDEVVMDTMGGELHTRRLTLRRWRPANISALNLHAMGPCHGGLVASELESMLAVPLLSTLEVSIFFKVCMHDVAKFVSQTFESIVFIV
jgi:hypothetical protein